MSKYLLSAFLFVVTAGSHAQDTTRQHAFSAEYVLDTYLNLTGSAGPDDLAPDILFNYKKQNELSLNIFLARLKWVKGNLALHAGLMAGDYGRYNMAAEPAVYRHIYELYAHYRINEKFSADAGILNSHIGLESVPAKDNWNAGRSILAENSPYYETGMRLDFQANDQWRFSALLLNGWQHIRDNNKAAAVGTQIQYKPSGKWLFNVSGFAGNEEKIRHAPLRYFIDFFCTLDITSGSSLALVADGGIRKMQAGKDQHWGGAAILFRQRCTKWMNAAARLEYFSDPHQVVSTGISTSGFNGSGYSINLDLIPDPHVLFRLEGRILHASFPYFQDAQGGFRSDQSLLAVLSFRF